MLMKTIRNQGARLISLVAILLALAGGVGAQQLNADEELNKGVAAYKAAQYEQAIEHFRNAIHLDEHLNAAHLYLATAYMQQYVPGVDTPENKAIAEQAIAQYQAVLADDPKSVTSMKGIASLYMNMKNFEASRDYYMKVIEADPDDPEAYYSVGVIDWVGAYKDTSDRKARRGLVVEARVKSRQLCEEIKAANADRIDEGIRMLAIAMEKRPNYEEAMAYSSLLYRRKADTECGNPQAYANDIKLANEWTDKAMAGRLPKKFQEVEK